MKKLIAILALTAAILPSAAFTANAAYAAQRSHASTTAEPSSEAVTFNGKRGQDPDPFIRYQINRDFQASH